MAKITINIPATKDDVLLRWKAMVVSSGKSMSQVFDEATEWYIVHVKNGGKLKKYHDYKGKVVRTSVCLDPELLIYIDKLATNVRYGVLKSPAEAKRLNLPGWKRLDYQWMAVRIVDCWLDQHGFPGDTEGLEKARSIIHEARKAQLQSTLINGRRIRLDNLLARREALASFADDELQKKAEALESIQREPKPSYILKSGE